MSETVHAGCVALDGVGVLISGRSGSGKSDLALRLIDRGARLVSDDYTELAGHDGRLIARAPGRIAGQMEVRGIGLLRFEALAQAPVALLVDLDLSPERMPEAKQRLIAGVPVPVIALAGLEASAPIKVELALDAMSLRPS